jgi:hypothetical protein
MEKEKTTQRNLKLAAETMEKKKVSFEKSGGRKTKKERDVENRMKDQEAFLLFLKKEKESDKEEKKEKGENHSSYS